MRIIHKEDFKNTSSKKKFYIKYKIFSLIKKKKKVIINKIK